MTPQEEEKERLAAEQYLADNSGEVSGSTREEIAREAAEARSRMDGELLFRKLRKFAAEKSLDVKEVETGYKGRRPEVLAEIEVKKRSLELRGLSSRDSQYMHITGACSEDCYGDRDCENHCTIVIRLGDHRGFGYSFSLVYGADPRNEETFTKILAWLEAAAPFDDRELAAPEGWTEDRPIVCFDCGEEGHMASDCDGSAFNYDGDGDEDYQDHEAQSAECFNTAPSVQRTPICPQVAQTCSVCKEDFSSKTKFRQHAAEKHPGVDHSELGFRRDAAADTDAGEQGA